MKRAYAKGVSSRETESARYWVNNLNVLHKRSEEAHSHGLHLTAGW
jgi:hypothetical protein